MMGRQSLMSNIPAVNEDRAEAEHKTRSPFPGQQCVSVEDVFKRMNELLYVQLSGWIERHDR